MAISLRKKLNRNKTISTYYLDIYFNGKRYYEFLKNLKHNEKPKNPAERLLNKENEILAKKIKANREQELESNGYNVTPQFKQKVDFLELYQSFVKSYTKGDKRVVEASFQKFKQFLFESEIKQLQANELNESLVYEYKTYLENHLKGESPANYFKKFKMLLKYGMRKKIILTNPASDITIKKKDSIRKAILTDAEIATLATTPISNVEVKKAFLFCLYTGLRYSDVKVLKWENIDFTNKLIELKQQKTKEFVSIEMHPTAAYLIGTNKRKNECVFVLPSHTACTKHLKSWTAKAGINKHITWHCARHSFATNIIFHGADVNTASNLLGHSSLRYTERYTHVVKSLKQKAIGKLPTLNLSN